MDTKEDAGHSLPYLAAVALLDRQVLREQFELSRIRRADVQRLMTKVKARNNNRFTSDYPECLHLCVNARVKSGIPISVERTTYRGFFRTPMQWPELIDKFRRLGRDVASSTLSGITECVRDLENRRISDLVGTLREVASPASLMLQ